MQDEAVKQYSIPELMKLSKQWSYVRDIHTLDPSGQTMKFLEEYAETVVDGVLEMNAAAIIDGLGDIAVVAVVALTQLETSIAKYNFIKGLHHPEFVPIEIFQQEVQQIHQFTSTLPIENEALHLSRNIHVLAKNIVSAYKSPETYDGHQIFILLVNLFVRLDGIAAHVNSDLSTAWSAAYDEIKDRKGKVVNDVFVKEADL